MDIKNENIIFPDYSESIVNLSSSILNHFGVKPTHNTIPMVDQILARGYKHVVVVLLDGLGMNILESNLNYRDFLRRHLLGDISSVFPPTTVASTTSFLSEKTPVEHGWLGWDVYFEQEDKTVTCFFNILQDTDKDAASYNIPNKYLPYETIFEKINKAGTAKATGIFPFPAFGYKGHDSMYDWFKAIRKSIDNEDRTFTYAYWSDPDSLLHKLGNRSQDVEKCIRQLNNGLIELCESSKDTVFFVTADHGHTAIQNDFLCENYPSITKMLERQVSIEPRAISFYVKPEFKEKFPEEFNKHFEKDYMLLSKEDVMKENLFGDKTPNENLTGIGDYIAIATGSKTLLWSKKNHQFRSHHAGMTKNEMRIPLIWFESKKQKSLIKLYYGIIAILIAYLVYIYFF